MIVLYVLLGLVGFYILCGFIIVGIALRWLVETQDTNPHHKDLVRMYKEMSPKAKAHAWICALWYAVVCWLPVALGWMTRPSEFLNESKK